MNQYNSSNSIDGEKYVVCCFTENRRHRLKALINKDNRSSLWSCKAEVVSRLYRQTPLRSLRGAVKGTIRVVPRSSLRPFLG